MTDLYDSERMAEGYALRRPAVHPPVIERVRKRLGPVARAVDVGCGAGLSTAALECLAGQAIGIDPWPVMVRWGPRVAPRSLFAAGCAEAIPVRSGWADLITAAGSLNYVDLERFFAEAARVLAPGGTLVVYDFGPGREFRDGGGLAGWHDDFERRYPPPACADITPADVKAVDTEEFQAGLTLSPESYLEYILTETAVAAAIGRRTPEPEIRKWCATTLAPVFRGETREVVFRGYIAYTPAARLA